MTSQRPYLNLGCGTIILPTLEKPEHYSLLPDSLMTYPLYLNVDRNAGPGVDRVMDLFKYPWDLPDNAFDGALLAHIVEHIPHEIHYSGYPDIEGRFEAGSDALRPDWLREWFNAVECEQRLRENFQDGWYLFFAELYRVLTPGAIVHLVSPYSWSQGAVTDPTHTRLITEQTMTHSMFREDKSSFHYKTGGINFKFRGWTPRANGVAMPYAHDRAMFEHAFQTMLNMLYEGYYVLEVVKE